MDFIKMHGLGNDFVVTTVESWAHADHLQPTPGNGDGQYGEGYFRIALTVSQARLKEAFDRMYAAFGKVGF